METSLVIYNLLNPPVLFFFLGMVAVIVRSDLEIPHPLPRLMSLYLLLAIGFRGGVELHRSPISQEIIWALVAAILMALIVPFYTFFILRIKLDVANSAAIAATYGSISAVTFLTAASFLEKLGVRFGGHMVAAMALMESPAIVIGVMLARIFGSEGGSGAFSWSKLTRDAFLNGSVFLLVGSLIIGMATGPAGEEVLRPFSEEIFAGVLTFFLLDMGLVAARRISDMRKSGVFLIGFAVLIPLVNAGVGILIAAAIGMRSGDALMFAVLCSSGSYIAVPAAMRMALPEANPSLYVPMALALTFPFNVLLGIPLYFYVIDSLIGAIS